MENLLAAREAIYDQFQGSSTGLSFFFRDENQDRYAAYYTAMYLLQDTAEALLMHRQQGFSPSALTAYLEYWGVMQALFVQQDALAELYAAVTDNRLMVARFPAWQDLRDLRNRSAGHPAKRDRGAPLTRTYMGRNFGGYSAIAMEVWSAGTSEILNPCSNLGGMIDAYEAEAVTCLQEILNSMQQQWP